MKKRDVALSIPAGLAWGALVSLGVTLAGTVVLTWLVDRQRLAMEKIGYGLLVLLLLGSYLGAMMAYRRIKRRRLLVCLASGAVYLALLLTITALFFGGQYSGVCTTALLILAGSGAAALLGAGQGRGSSHKKIKVKGR